MSQQLFQKSKDIAFFKRINSELYKRFMYRIGVYKYDHGYGDKLYGEDRNKTFSITLNNGDLISDPTYYVDAYFPDLPDWQSKLTKFGLDEERSLNGFFYADDDIRLPEVGDRILLQGDLYKVNQSNPKDYFGNTGVAMTHSIALVRWRPESVEIPRVFPEEPLYPESKILITESSLPIGMLQVKEDFSNKASDTHWKDIDFSSLLNGSLAEFNIPISLGYKFVHGSEFVIGDGTWLIRDVDYMINADGVITVQGRVWSAGQSLYVRYQETLA